MWIRSSKRKTRVEFEREFERGVLRSAFVSVFWAVISARKRSDGFTMKQLADKLGVDKSAVSRWFSGDPNWETNTIADIANALDVDIKVMAVDRMTGRRFAPFGEIAVRETETQPSMIEIDRQPAPTSTRSSGIHLHVAA